MAGYGDNDGAANNSFGRRSLHQWEGLLLYMAGYPVPSDFRAPGGWRLSAGGVPIPPPPMGSALDAAIDEVLKTMSDEQQRRLLDLAAARRRAAAAAAQPARGAPVIKLEDSNDDDWYQPTPPRDGDAG
jgi:hypothetical protein